MARALTADEQQRYPWATRISDFVPVGRWRKIGLACVAGRRRGARPSASATST